MSKLVIVQIVNYNGYSNTGTLFLESIDSILRQTYKNILIHVLDNGSRDGSLKMIRERFPAVKITKMMRNWGYTAHNFGIPYFDYYDAGYMLLMNNDVILEEHCLEKLIEKCSDENTGAVMPAVNFLDKPDYTNSAGLHINYAGFACNAGFDTPYAERGAVEGNLLSGAVMLIKREAVKRTGLFDVFFGSYYEDADFSLRLMSETDMKTAVVHDALCYHNYSSSYSSNPGLRDYLTMRNQYMLILKLFPAHILFPALIYLYRTRFLKRITLQARVFIELFLLLPVISVKRMIHTVRSKRSIRQFLHPSFSPFPAENRKREYAVIADKGTPDEYMTDEIIFSINDNVLGTGFSYITDEFPQGRFVNSRAEFFLKKSASPVEIHGKGNGTFSINGTEYKVNGFFTVIYEPVKACSSFILATEDSILFLSIRRI